MLKGLQTNFFNASQRTVRGYLKLKKGDSFSGEGYENVFGNETANTIATQVLPASGVIYIPQFLTARPVVRFGEPAMDIEEKAAMRASFESTTQITVKLGETRDAYSTSMSTLLPYESILNDAQGYDRLLKREYGLRLYDEALEEQFQAALANGRIEESELKNFFKLGDTYTTMMALKYGKPFSVGVKTPNMLTDSDGITHAVGKYVKEDEYFIEFAMDTLVFAIPQAQD